MQPVRFLNDANHIDLAELYQRHAPALLTHLRLNVSSIEDAEDLLLDIFVAALGHEALRGISLDEQRFWLWRVARNKLVDYYRKRSIRLHFPLEDVSESVYQDDAFEPESLALRSEEHLNLLAAIEELPPFRQLMA
jgi:RNA polymerase sigma factor (sigma-70 family)